MIVLNKVDLVDRTRIDEIKVWLDSRMHRYTESATRLAEQHVPGSAEELAAVCALR